MDTSYRSFPRKLRRRQSMNTSQAAHLGNSSLREWIATTLGDTLREMRLEIKEAANDLDCAPKTIENLLRAQNGISVELLRRMAERWPAMRPAIRAFFFLENELDAETEKLLATIMAHTQRART